MATRRRHGVSVGGQPTKEVGRDSTRRGAAGEERSSQYFSRLDNDGAVDASEFVLAETDDARGRASSSSASMRR